MDLLDRHVESGQTPESQRNNVALHAHPWRFTSLWVLRALLVNAHEVQAFSMLGLS